MRHRWWAVMRRVVLRCVVVWLWAVGSGVWALRSRWWIHALRANLIVSAVVGANIRLSVVGLRWAARAVAVGWRCGPLRFPEAMPAARLLRSGEILPVRIRRSGVAESFPPTARCTRGNCVVPCSGIRPLHIPCETMHVLLWGRNSGTV